MSTLSKPTDARGYGQVDLDRATIDRCEGALQRPWRPDETERQVSLTGGEQAAAAAAAYRALGWVVTVKEHAGPAWRNEETSYTLTFARLAGLPPK